MYIYLHLNNIYIYVIWSEIYIFLVAIHAIVTMRSLHCDRRTAIIAGRLFCLMPQ